MPPRQLPACLGDQGAVQAQIQGEHGSDTQVGRDGVEDAKWPEQDSTDLTAPGGRNTRRGGTTNSESTAEANKRVPTDQSKGQPQIGLRPGGMIFTLDDPNNTILWSQHAADSSPNRASSARKLLTHLRIHDQDNIDKMADALLRTKRKHDEQLSDDQPDPKKRMRMEDEGSFHGSGNENKHPAVCKPCRAQKKGCEETRPCSRCVKAGNPELCVPTIAKQHRRPRYKDKAERVKPGADSTQNKARPKPVPILNLDSLAAGPVNQQTMRHPQDPRSQLHNSERPSPTLAPSTSQHVPFTPTTRPASTNPMMEPRLTSLPSLIRGKGRGVYIIDLRNLVTDGQTTLQLATQNQHSLIELRANNPPAAGYWPHVLIDSAWSEKTKAVPESVNCLIHIPDTECGDFWGLFSAPTSKTQGHRDYTCLIETPQNGRMLWACLSKKVVDAIRYYNGTWLRIQRNQPVFLPGTMGFQNWISAAETWISDYELPIGQEYVCCCRKRREDCQVRVPSTLAFEKTMVKTVADDGKTTYSVSRRMVEERTIVCQAGERCGNGEYHLSCLGISQENWEDVLLALEWWCPTCRERWPNEAKRGVLLKGERLELRMREHEPKAAKPMDSRLFGPQPTAERRPHRGFEMAK
ncbi:hypothetical protein E2P81_ATG07878 [Venturia nashicola]|nr:hypothetical protein E2P81_ATG07878 [Venturia nashicola]